MAQFSLNSKNNEKRPCEFGITCTFQSSLLMVMQFWKRKRISADNPLRREKLDLRAGNSGTADEFGVQMLHVSSNKYEVWVIFGVCFSFSSHLRPEIGKIFCLFLLECGNASAFKTLNNSCWMR